MQKRSLYFPLLKFKKQNFFLFVLYIGFAVCQPYTINIYTYVQTVKTINESISMWDTIANTELCVITNTLQTLCK